MSAPNQNEQELRRYYEEEARLGTRSALVGRRVEFRNTFIEHISGEARHSVIDFGAGPSGDGSGFIEAGYEYVGLDLAHGNCVRAAESGKLVVQGSLRFPPFLPGSFDTGWSMSTLMHLPENEVETALAAMCLTLSNGSPLCIGVWGAETGSEPVDQTQGDGIEGFERLFSLRTFERNRALVEANGILEHSSTWPVGPDGWEYHSFVLRVR